MKDLIKKNIKLIFPAVHFLLTFVFERSFLIFNDTGNTRMAIPLGNFFSDSAEHIVAYVISKLAAFIIIFLLWKLIFYVIKEIRDTATVLFLSLFLLLFVIFFVFLLPSVGMRSEDNYITYAYAVRLWPEYWHSAYLSCIYAGMMMVFPNPSVILFLQLVGLSFAAGYLFKRIEDSRVIGKRFRWIAFLMFLMPNIYILVVDPYRTEIYAIICMIFLTVIVMDSVDRKERPFWQMALLAVFAAFLGVFRSEGMILGVGGYLSALIFCYGYKFKQFVKLGAVCLAAFVVFLIPQKLGDSKYYGRDYTIINSFPSLVNILNDSSHDLDFDGAADDLSAIDRVVPLDVIRFYGMNGYHRYNIMEGRTDINQSYASGEDSAAYVRAFYDLVLHNLPIYFRTQFTMWKQSLLLNTPSYVTPPPPELTAPALPDFKLELWEQGWSEYVSDLNNAHWRDDLFRQRIAGLLMKVFNKIHHITFDSTKAASAVLILVLAAGICMMVREAVLFFVKRREDTGLGVMMLILLLQYAAIVLVMPAGAQVYFHATYFGMLIAETVYISKLLSKVRKKKPGSED